MGKRLIVIGGVAAGTSAAGRARRIAPDMEITLFEAGPYVSYGACDEPYFIAGVVPSWDKLLVRSPQEFRDRQKIDIRLGRRVTRVDPTAKTVEVLVAETGRIETHAYDALIFATGARPRPLWLAGGDAANVFHLKSLDSARRLDVFIRENAPRRAVCLGAGFIVLELTEALHRRGVACTILHRSDKPGSILEREIAELVRRELERQGVVYIPHALPTALERDANGLVTAVRAGDASYPADLVVAGLGVLPNVEVGAAAGLKVGPTGAFAVDEGMRTNLPDIYAAGDCVETINRVSGLPHHYPLGDLANKQGWTAGENAAGGRAVYRGAIGSLHFKCFDLEVGVTGLGIAEAVKAGFDPATTVITHRSRAHAQPGSHPITVKLIADRPSGRLLGGQIAGREGAALRINTLAMAVHAGLTVAALNEADLAYAPPFSPVIDPILVAARDLVKKL